MRKIAERIEFSATAIYEYFPNRKELLTSLAQRGFAQLHFSPGRARGEGPRVRLLDIVEKRWDFAFENQALYLFAFMLDAISEVACGHRNDPDDLADILWAAMSRLIGLAASGRIESGPIAPGVCLIG